MRKVLAAVAAKVRPMRALGSVYGYQYADGTLTPLCTPIARDAAGVLTAWFSTIASHKGATIPGAALTGIDYDAPVFYTYLAVTRAARKAGTPVILGRPVDLKRGSRFATELARLKGRPASALVLADWRVASHDAVKEQYTLQELDAALRESYIQ
jgi:hypothetical protein